MHNDHDSLSEGLGWARAISVLALSVENIQVMRAPLVGQTIEPLSWLVCVGMAIVGWALALVAMKNYRARISYWV